MRVAITTPPGIFVDGSLDRVIAEQDGAAAHIVIEMSITGGGSSAHVTVDESDLFTIVRLAKASAVEKIRDAVS
jgi:hypothetical protein